MTGRLDIEYRLIGADGVLRWVRDRGRVRIEDGRRFLDGSILDVTEMYRIREALVAARAEADRLAQIDHLTGVANRRSLAPVLTATPAGPSACSCSTSTTSRQINDAPATPPATRCWSRSPTACAPRCGPTTPSCGWAGRSSSSSCATWPTRPSCARWASTCGAHLPRAIDAGRSRSASRLDRR